MNQLTQQQISKASVIKISRGQAQQKDSLEYQKKANKFLDWLQCHTISLIKTLEMYPDEIESIKSTPEIYQYFNRYHNTRTQISSETRAEIDKLDFDKAVNILCEVMLSLIRNKIHFAVFYAEGQRSPHVIIYDWDNLEELTPFQRIRAQVKFWRKHFPFGTFQYCDTGVFDSEHYQQIEFRPHWKYGTIFDLLFEWIPKQEEVPIKIVVKKEPEKKIIKRKSTAEYNIIVHNENEKRHIDSAKLINKIREKYLE